MEHDALFVTVDLMILFVEEGGLHLLLGKRPRPPFQDRWALPGRFVALDESAETTARRLLSEWMNTDEAWLEQLYTFTAVNRDPRGRVISLGYLVILPGRPQFAGDAPQLRDFAVRLDEGGLRLTDREGVLMTEGDLAFDHGQIARVGLQRLRGKIDYTEIGFWFLKNRSAFTLSELQGIYEAVLARPLDASNFRRGVLSRYEETGRMVQTDQSGRRSRGRPAALYRFYR